MREHLAQHIEALPCQSADKDAGGVGAIGHFEHVTGVTWLLVLGQGIDLVEDQHLRDLCGANGGQHALHFSHLLQQHVAGGVDHVLEHIGLGGLQQGGLERLDQCVRQVADEAHSV